MLGEQGFAIIYEHVSKLELETAELRAQTNTECPTASGTATCPSTADYGRRLAPGATGAGGYGQIPEG